MIYVLYTIFFLSCIVLIVSVLLQPGKTDAGALFTSSVSSTAFGARGTQTILSKVTIVVAALFMLFALFIGLAEQRKGNSVLQANPEVVSESSTAPTDAAANSNTAAANANTAANTEAKPAEANTAANEAPKGNSNTK